MKKKENKNLGGGKVVYLDDKKEDVKDSITTYNTSADDIEIDKLVKKVYDNWMGSKKRELMLEGIKYYNNKTKIDDKVRYDYNGIKGKENNKLSNAKQKKNFMHKQTRQKANYFMGNPFTISTENDDYTELLENEYFNKYFHKQCFNLVLESIKEGINWVNPYYDEKGILQFRRIPGHEVYPFWSDRDHTKLAQLIHFYEIEVYEGDKSRNVTYADYYYKKGVIHYIMEDKGFVRDSERPLEEGNFTIMKPKKQEHIIGVDEKTKKEILNEEIEVDENGNPIMEPVQMVWDILPWIPLKYNTEELSLLTFLKESQDNYEMLISNIIDILKDIPDSIKKIKGYSGENLEQLMNDISLFRAILVDGDGDVDSLETKFNIEAFKIILDTIRKDAYEDGSSVDTQSNETGEKSGVSLKFLYSDLDNDCRDLEKEFDTYIETILKFIDYDIQMKHKKDYFDIEVEVNYNKAMIINESEIIGNINKSGGLTLPEETLLNLHPYVDDVNETKKLMEKAQKEEEQKMEEDFKKFGNQGFSNNFNKK